MSSNATFCPNCGAARVGEAAFCGSCGRPFATSPAQGGGVESNVAAGMLTLQGLWLKLIVGRVLGIAVGLAIWYFIVGPNVEPLVTVVAFFVLAFAGLLVGQTVTLQLVAGRK